MQLPSLALRVVGLALRLTCWSRYNWTGSTGNIPRKRRDITEFFFNNNQSRIYAFPLASAEADNQF